MVVQSLFADAFSVDLTAPQTPIIKAENVWLKRDDLYEVCGAYGAKARACFYLISKAKGQGFELITTAGSRKSPQINICAQICKVLGLQFVAHAPQGALGEELIDAQVAGAEIIQHKAGYNSVIKQRAEVYAQQNKGYCVPFGMVCREAIQQTVNQVQNLPDCKRIIIPVGSGMNLIGLLHGLKVQGLNIPVLGVVVGANPNKTISKYNSNYQNYTLINAGIDYHKEVNYSVGGVLLDPIYEAKCGKFLQDGDLMWCVGIRSTLVKQ